MKRFFILGLLLLLPLTLTACSEIELASHLVKTKVMPGAKPTPTKGTFKVGNPYKIADKWYYPQESYDLVETGIASWYGPGFHGRKTANGEIFDENELTAAHRTLQMPSLVRVTNLENGRSLIVRVNDRGPYSKGRVIDLSKKAAELLGYQGQGVTKVKLQVLKQESLQVANAAKSGQSTRGYELAANRKKVSPTIQAIEMPPEPTTLAQMPAVRRETLVTAQSPTGIKTVLAGQNRGGAFYPDSVVTEYPVSNSNIYIQAGSFSVRENAAELTQSLEGLTKANIYPTIVNGRKYYRVRLGPINSVQEADQLLSRVVANGHRNALIVVD